MGKKSDLSDFDRGMIVGGRRAGLSVSKTAHLLGFSRTTVSRVYSEWQSKEKTSSERQFCGRKRLVDERGLLRMAGLVRADSKATVTEITTLYNCGEQKSISECTTRRTLRRMGYMPRAQERRENDRTKEGYGGPATEVEAGSEAIRNQVEVEVTQTTSLTLPEELSVLKGAEGGNVPQGTQPPGACAST